MDRFCQSPKWSIPIGESLSWDDSVSYEFPGEPVPATHSAEHGSQLCAVFHFQDVLESIPAARNYRRKIVPGTLGRDRFTVLVGERRLGHAPGLERLEQHNPARHLVLKSTVWVRHWEEVTPASLPLQPRGYQNKARITHLPSNTATGDERDGGEERSSKQRHAT